MTLRPRTATGTETTPEATPGTETETA